MLVCDRRGRTRTARNGNEDGRADIGAERARESGAAAPIPRSGGVRRRRRNGRAAARRRTRLRAERIGQGGLRPLRRPPYPGGHRRRAALPLRGQRRRPHGRRIRRRVRPAGSRSRPHPAAAPMARPPSRRKRASRRDRTSASFSASRTVPTFIGNWRSCSNRWSASCPDGWDVTVVVCNDGAPISDDLAKIAADVRRPRAHGNQPRRSTQHRLRRRRRALCSDEPRRSAQRHSSRRGAGRRRVS